MNDTLAAVFSVGLSALAFFALGALSALAFVRLVLTRDASPWAIPYAVDLIRVSPLLEKALRRHVAFCPGCQREIHQLISLQEFPQPEQGGNHES